MKNLLIATVILVLSLTSAANVKVQALTRNDLNAVINGYPNFDAEGDTCTTNSPISGGVSITQQDFAPDPAALEIFSTDRKPKIDSLTPLYQKAAQAEGLADWQLLPAIHSIESGASKKNPTGNTSFGGVFQMNVDSLTNANLYDSTTYQPGKELTDEEFTTQAQAAIKAFLAPNAKQLGIDIAKSLSTNDVMRLAISYKSGANSPWLKGQADPNFHPYAWAGFDSTPAHKLPMYYGPGGASGDESTSSKLSIPGAVTTFMLLKGSVTSAGTCGGQNTSIRSKIVSLAQEELGRWSSKELTVGSGYLKYSNNIRTDWCAYFASWVYAQVGVPLTSDSSGHVAAVEDIKQLAMKAGHYHERGDSSTYVPQPGDIVVRQNGESHVNIVVAISGDKISVIGGNQGGDGKQGSYFETSRVSEYTTSLTDDGISGYVSPE